MKGYQQLRLSVNKDLQGNYIPKVQVSLVKEIYVSNTSYSCSGDVSNCEIVEKELRNPGREE